MSQSNGEKPDSITIPMDAMTRIFFMGVAAGQDAADQLDIVATSEDHATRERYFWFKVGTVMAAKVAEVTEVIGDDEVSVFITGAATRAPQEFLAVKVTVSPKALEQFAGDDDSDRARDVLSTLVQSAALRIGEGEDKGDLFNSKRQCVGSFTLDM